MWNKGWGKDYCQVIEAMEKIYYGYSAKSVLIGSICQENNLWFYVWWWYILE